MTKLLISVKNIEEAMLVLAAGVDIIDLKDPNEGALGALNLTMIKQIVQKVNGRSLLSATVGEQHASIHELVSDIQLRANVGVDVVKIAVSDLFKQDGFFEEMNKLTQTGIKLIAVFFADEAISLDVLPALKSTGFYGAMIDTRNKSKNLLQIQSQQALKLFTLQCRRYQLMTGLAGSLQPQHIDFLIEINPTYIGFRGGVCENAQRKSTLNASKVSQIIHMLRNDNKNAQKHGLCSVQRCIVNLHSV